jgi:demethylmenaquinone methyltransferase/2-methoxy-6-polyprenyl-1,4-benzoquinol methylase
VKWSGANLGQRVLDCATGTGDLAIEFKVAVGSVGEVIGTDFCAEMLSHAPAKADKKGLAIHFEQADVTQLPYDDKSFDIASISFGIRNVQEPLKGLSELARVVRPGGCVMVLEFGQPAIPGFREVYDAYSRFVLPKLGGMITGKSNAYEYLQNSSARFPCRDEFSAMLMSTGCYTSCEFKALTLGVAYMYKAVVA